MCGGGDIAVVSMNLARALGSAKESKLSAGTKASKGYGVSRFVLLRFSWERVFALVEKEGLQLKPVLPTEHVHNSASRAKTRESPLFQDIAFLTRWTVTTAVLLPLLMETRPYCEVPHL